MRLFIGIPIPGHIADDIHRRVTRRIDRNGISCIPKERYHITLVFLGERDELELPHIISCFETAGKQASLVPLHCSGIITFPSGAAPRTIVSPVESGNYEITALSRELHAALGMKGRMGKSIPHLTVARVRKGTSIDRGRLVRSLGPLIDIRFTPERLVLYQSHLERSGARYEELRSIRLHNEMGKTND